MTERAHSACTRAATAAVSWNLCKAASRGRLVDMRAHTQVACGDAVPFHRHRAVCVILLAFSGHQGLVVTLPPEIRVMGMKGLI